MANNGEDSFQTYVNITLPEDVAFVNVKMVTDPPVLCYLGNNSKYLLCDVGNPLRTGESVGNHKKFIRTLKQLYCLGAIFGGLPTNRH